MAKPQWQQLTVNDDENYRSAALIVPSGMIVRTREFSMLGKTEVTVCESSVYVPCADAQQWIKENSTE